jgi:tetrahydromethanopterin S-methyltransferase subunit B
MKLLKAGGVYINPEMIVTLDQQTGYIRTAAGDSLKLDPEETARLIVYLTQGTMEAADDAVHKVGKGNNGKHKGNVKG